VRGACCSKSTTNARLPCGNADHLVHVFEQQARIERIAESDWRRLLLLARYGEPEVSHRTLPRLSQHTLAEMVGTTAHANFFMNKFRKLRFIEYSAG
jgi:hypothetical protein